MSTIISLVAAPGSGKTTQTDLFVAQNPSTVVLRASAILAEYMSHIRTGQLIDDDIVNRKMHPHILEALAKNPDFLILDGYPRTLRQLEYVHHLATSCGALYIATYISLSIPVALERLESRRKVAELAEYENNIIRPVLRTDDDPLVVENRIKEFKKKTKSLLSWLKGGRNQHVLYLQIDGSGTEEQVSAQFSTGVRIFLENKRMVRQEAVCLQ